MVSIFRARIRSRVWRTMDRNTTSGSSSSSSSIDAAAGESKGAGERDQSGSGSSRSPSTSPPVSRSTSSLSASSSSTAIEVHLRIRPSSNPSTYHAIDDLDPSTLIFTVPTDHRAATAAATSTAKGGYVDNTRTRYAFKFNSILEPSTSQATVFRNIGVPAIRNALEGYNSTVL